MAEYPQYAAAWTALGKVRDAAGDVDSAREAFAHGIAADPDYMPPYEPLIRLEMRQQQWQRVSDLSEKLLELHEGLDMVRYYQAKASFFLDDFDKAEALARQLLSGAASIELAEVHQLLGVIHARKGRFKPAAGEYRRFLAARPDSDAAALMKKQLAEWEAKGVLAE